MIITRYEEVEAYRTKDASEIRELMHPDSHGNRAQSLAQACVLPGQSTLLHKHLNTEELYHFLCGKGVMTVGTERLEEGAGDTVCIPPNTPHKVLNTDKKTMQIMCCCSPPYSHEDTVVLEKV